MVEYIGLPAFSYYSAENCARFVLGTLSVRSHIYIWFEVFRLGPNLYRNNTTLRTLLVAAGFVLLGVAAMVVASYYLDKHPNAQEIVRSLGGLFIATVALTVVWDLAAKRSLLAELMAITQLAEDVKTAGIVHITSDFYRGFDWASAFEKAKEFDLLFAYGHTWRGMNQVYMQRSAEKKGTKIRILLPDPEDAEVVKELARRFSTQPDALKMEIQEATRNFQKIFRESESFGLWYMPLAPVYSWYRFDQNAVVAFYKHGQERTNVPSLVVEQGGTVFNFMRNEFEALVKDGGRARRVQL